MRRNSPLHRTSIVANLTTINRLDVEHHATEMITLPITATDDQIRELVVR